MLDKWFKKEKPVFTGITRGIGGFGFGAAGGGHHVNQLFQMKVRRKTESKTSLGLQCFL